MERMLRMTINMERDVVLANECLLDVTTLVDEEIHPCVIKSSWVANSGANPQFQLHKLDKIHGNHP